MSLLPESAQARLKRGKPSDGSVTINGKDYFFAARHVIGAKKPFILLRAKDVTSARGTPYVYSLLFAEIGRAHV